MAKQITFYSAILMLWMVLGFSGTSVYAQCSGEVLNIASTTPNINGISSSWIVPSGGPYKVKIQANGAKGGSGGAGNMPGGYGATMIGTFLVSSGQTLDAIAGSPGQDGGSNNGGGGGGGSGVKIQSIPLIIAGAGGGGAIAFYSGAPGLITSGNGNGGSCGNGSGGGGFNSNGCSASLSVGGGGGFGGLGGNIYIIGGGGFGGGASCYSGGGGGGGYSGGNGGCCGISVGGGGGSINFGANQVNTPGANNAGGQVVIECLGTALVSATFTPTQPVCANPTQGSLSIDLTGDLNGNTNGVEYAIVSGNSFSGTPTFADITADPFNITSGFGTTGAIGGSTYTVRIRLKYNPTLYIDNTYTLNGHSVGTIYVNHLATGANNGTSWADAFTDLQSALANACSGAHIWVAAGTYKPTTGTDRTISFVMKNGVAIYGGFAGTETSLSERDWAANVTTLSGDIGTPNDNIDNSYHVVANNNNGLNSSAILDGFTISGGNADEGYLQNSYGGGILNVFSSPLVRNCRFMNNAAINGGGIYNDNSESEIINCLFTSNSAFGPGGGMSNNYSGSPLITNCTFSGNSASQGGAIVNIYDGTTPQITNCIIWGNSSGIENIYSANPTITYSIIQGGYSGIGNQNVDPLFVNATGGNLRLQPCSPAINAGDNASVPSGITTDLDGNPRFYNSGTVDIGAYEYQGAAVSGPVVYVNDDASGNNDGTSWTDACNDLQSALTMANTCSNITEIWVASGTYKPTSGTDRNISFSMKNGVAIYGGFIGTETLLNERNWISNLTILSGDIGGVGNSDNSYHVITTPDFLSSSAILDGFTITGGNADSGPDDLTGGGIRNGYYASPTLTNCRITGNSAQQGGGWFSNSSFSMLINVVFSGNNTSTDGGGMSNIGSLFPNLSNVVFLGNNAGNLGGGIFNQSGSVQTLTNVTFSGNKAVAGGGIFYNYVNVPQYLKNCIFWGNSSDINYSGNKMTITNSILQENCPAGAICSGVVISDPLFVSQPDFASAPTTAGDMRLQPCSPAINAGDNASVPSGITTDLDGNPRFYNNGTVDMGAYEYQSVLSDGTRWYVNAAVGNSGNGTSWDCAFKDLQNALAASGSGDTIWVAAGTYKPTSGTDRSISFVMKDGVAIYGGFIGTETLLNERDWITNVTILSGDIGGVGNSDNSYHVINNDGLGLNSSALIDGFTISGGSANGNTDYYGGGVSNNTSSPSIVNCTITGNYASYGGGIFNFSASPTITNCNITGNQATGGGGMFNNSSSNPAVVNCIFSGNQANDGGGIYNVEYSSPGLTNCTFSGNKANNGGALFNNFNASPQLKNSIIWGNSSSVNNYDNSNPTYTFSLTEGLNPAGIGNLDGTNPANDPLFINQPDYNTAPTAAGDLRLKPCSPAINTGNNASVPSGITTDLDGNPRFFNSGIVDMGAYEYQGAAVTGPVVHVNDDASGNNDGTSWTDAFNDLQDALALANTCSNVTEIWVAAGTYKPTSGTDRNISFSMKNGVAIYGGFAGTETQLSERNLSINTSVISGDIGTPGDNSDNTFHIFYNNDLNQTAVLDGFTVRDGKTAEAYNNAGRGAGMYNNSASPLIRNCIFINNNAMTFGGAINSIYSNALVINCLFYNNNGLIGGAISNHNSSVTVINCTFSGNTGSGSICSDQSSTLTQIYNSIVWGNGISNNNSGNTVVSQSIVQGGYPGTGNLDLDPLFIDAPTGDLRLQPCSPAINAGDNASVLSGITTDLDGNPRFFNNGIVDMGAYEYQGAAVTGSVVYVNDDATGNNDGTSWTDAFNDLQDALALANTCSNIAEIWVAAGTYNPTSGTDRTISFVMKNGVAIYGGLVGNEAANYDLSLRNFTTNPTILSGDIDKNDGANFANNSGNSYHVISNPPGLTNSAILDGFTITAGNANEPPINGSTSHYSRGGGMYNNGDGEGNFCNPLIRYCTFQGNTASNGGGMYNRAYRGTSSPILTNCSFLGNTAAPDDGGGMFNYGGLDGTSSPILTNCSFQGNTAVSSTTSSDGGAMKNAGNSSPILTNCSFQGNTAANEAGAMSNEGTFSINSPILTNCSFQGNTAGSEGGGVMFNNGSHPILTNCVLFGNGGNNTFFNTSGTTVTATYSLFDITVTGYNTNGTGNLTTTTSPFVSTTLATLSACSPAINAGNPATTSATVGNVDLAGNRRFFNNGRVDMGAYEYQGAAVSGSVVYVNDDASGNNDGTSWTDACNDLQSALTIANTCSNITEIWVAAGTYTPTHDPFGNTNPADPRDRTFYLTDGVSLYGGFAGTETALSERNWSANPTILSGDFNGDDLVSGSGFSLEFPNHNENALHVIISVNDIQNNTLDGFTIKGGFANGYGEGVTVEGVFIPTNLGGGIYTVNSTGLIYNCSFYANYSSAGSGMYNVNPGFGLFNCTFSYNRAEAGGGMANSDGNMTLINCTFTGNVGVYGGGSAWNYSGQFTVMNSILWGNYGGELQNSNVIDIIVNRTLIQGGFTGTGNLNVDPLFVNAADPAGPDGYFGTADDGISIQSSSPAINAGSPAVTTPATDITGFTRIGVFDMGAYENQNPCVNPTDGGTISSNQNGCSPFDPVEITGATPTGHAGTLEYQWQSSIDNSTFTNITTGNYSSVNYNPGALTVTTWFKRIVKVTCESVWKESDVVKITVEQSPVSGSLAKTPNATNICAGENVSASLTSGTGGNGVDVLEYRTKTGVSTWSAWDNYTSGANISTTGKTAVEIQTLRKSDYCDDSELVTVSWTVDPTTVAGNIGGSSSITYGASTGNLTLTGNVGLVKKWQKRLGTSGAYTDIVHTSATYSETPSSAGTWQYRAQVQSGTCSEVFTNPHQVAVGTKELTIGGSFTANDKIYDDNTNASLDANDLEPSGLVGSDDVSLTGLEIDFASKMVGNHSVTITGASLTGTKSGNYTLSLTGSPETTATINPGPPANFIVTATDDGIITSPKLHNIPFDVKVTLVDAYENPTPNTGGSATVTLTGSGGATPGDLHVQGFPSDVVTKTMNSGENSLTFTSVLYTGVSAVAGFDVKVSASASGTGTANAKTGESNLFSVRDIFFSVEADPTAILADGTSTTAITVTLEDHDNNPLANQTITVETDKGTLMEGAVELTGIVTRTTDANGQVFLDLRSENASALATVTAKCPGACPQTAEVAFILNAPVITDFTPGEEQVTIEFNPPTNPGLTTIANYEYSLNDGADWTAFSPAQTSSPVTITGLIGGGLTYPAKLRAVNEVGKGAASDAEEVYAGFNPTDGGEIGSDQAICSGTTPALLTNESDASNYGGTLEYQWQSSTTNETDDFADIINKTEATYQPDALTQTTWFRRLAKVSCIPTWTGAAESNVVKVRMLGEEPISDPWNPCNTNISANGTSSYSPCMANGTFRLTATGKSTTTNDVMHFVYQEIGTVGTIIARLDDIDNGGYAGVMIRESCNPNAKTILFKTLLYNPNVFVGYRTTTGQAMRNLSQVAQLIHWMKIQRNGSNFKVFTSYNGTSWMQRYSGTINMGPTAFAGIFTESVRTDRTSVAWFDNVQVFDELKSGDEFAEADIINLESEDSEVQVYPNPADEQVTIVVPYNEKPSTISFITMNGKLAKTFSITGNQTQLNVQDLQPGIYILRIENTKSVVIKRLVIQ